MIFRMLFMLYLMMLQNGGMKNHDKENYKLISLYTLRV